MIGIKAKITKNRFPQIKRAIRKQVVNVVNETAEEVLDIAKQLAPYKTGELRNSGHLEFDSRNELQKVVFDAPHAPFIEFGTSNMEAQPFLRPAIASVKSRRNRRLGQIRAGLGKEVG